nr:MAG TPA: hypothetical protein [Caudoviricetes sp.]
MCASHRGSLSLTIRIYSGKFRLRSGHFTGVTFP